MASRPPHHTHRSQLSWPTPLDNKKPIHSRPVPSEPFSGPSHVLKRWIADQRVDASFLVLYQMSPHQDLSSLHGTHLPSTLEVSVCGDPPSTWTHYFTVKNRSCILVQIHAYWLNTDSSAKDKPRNIVARLDKRCYSMWTGLMMR